MAEQLTKLESSVYQYLLDFTAEKTYQPSIRDIKLLQCLNANLVRPRQ